jgi:tRNA nucleotidyltransferase (CCA-adding enzyme)
MLSNEQMEILRQFATAFKEAGGRALLVGGAVRDARLRLEPKDFDIEVYGLQPSVIVEVLKGFGTLDLVGASFEILKLHEYPEYDFSIPRRDSKVGPGHKDFEIDGDPWMSIEEAARRRDFTINSMALDPLTGEFFDPFDGMDDLFLGILRATDVERFGDDPLRALRAAKFSARFTFAVTPGTLDLLASMDLSHLSVERVFKELQDLLVESATPSTGLQLLQETKLLRFFPELQALVDCPQDSEWHPEGDVFDHTCKVCDAAAIRLLPWVNLKDAPALMWAALLHDAGKPSKTTHDADGHIRSRGHEEAGEGPTRALLGRLKAPLDLIEQVVALVTHHLAPNSYPGTAGPAGYRRLARKLAHAGTSYHLLEIVARADSLGRTCPTAAPYAGVRFIEEMEAAGANQPEMIANVVMGRHLIARGMTHDPKNGCHFGNILRRCAEIQVETGSTDPEFLLSQVLPA